MNDSLLRALLRQPTDHTPVWIMRQAGRYLPEYTATRQRAGSFLGLAQSPALACEVTLQPLDRYALDAAILFSDILTVPDDMGLGLSFADGEGPRAVRSRWRATWSKEEPAMIFNALKPCCMPGPIYCIAFWQSTQMPSRTI